MRFSKPVRLPLKALLLAGVLSATGCTGAEWDRFQEMYEIPRGYFYNLLEGEEEADVIPETRPDTFFTTDLPRRSGGLETLPAERDYSPGVYAEDPSVAVYPLEDDMALDGINWERAASDLTEQLVARFGMPGEPVYVAAEDPVSPLNQAFGPVFKQTLRARGFNIVERAGEGPFSLWYNVLDVAGENAVLIETFLLSGQTVMAEASGSYPQGAAFAPRTAEPYVPPPAPTYRDSTRDGRAPMSLISKP